MRSLDVRVNPVAGKHGPAAPNADAPLAGKRFNFRGGTFQVRDLIAHHRGRTRIYLAVRVGDHESWNGLARERTTKQRLVFKEVIDQEVDAVKEEQRFLREIKHMQEINHPRVVRLYSFLPASPPRHGNLIVMPYFAGGSLADLLEAGPVKNRQLVKTILDDLASGLQHCHSKGVFHRDVKPGNAFLSTEDPRGLRRAWLGDFGIAIAAKEFAEGLTQTGVALGTLPYMAPELIEGAKATQASDQYSLGCVLFEMLCGVSAMTVAVMGVAAQMTREAALEQAIRDFNPAASALVPVLMKSLSRSPGARYSSVRRFADQALLALEGQQGKAIGNAQIKPRAKAPLAKDGLPLGVVGAKKQGPVAKKAAELVTARMNKRPIVFAAPRPRVEAGTRVQIGVAPLQHDANAGLVAGMLEIKLICARVLNRVLGYLRSVGRFIKEILSGLALIVIEIVTAPWTLFKGVRSWQASRRCEACRSLQGNGMALRSASALRYRRRRWKTWIARSLIAVLALYLVTSYEYNHRRLIGVGWSINPKPLVKDLFDKDLLTKGKRHGRHR